MTKTETTPTPITPLRMAREVLIAVIGMTALALGVALIVVPGPALVAVPLGLAILATEFPWARRLLRQFRHGAKVVRRRSRVTWRGNAHPRSELRTSR